MGAYDSGYKHLFSFKAMVEDLLRGFVHERWVELLDFETLERKNGSYVSDDLREREDDIIWRAKWKGTDEWMYVYFVIEFQSHPDPSMALRMVNYVTLLYQDLVHTGDASPDSLPPVLPMVIYRGERAWAAARNFSDLIHAPPGELKRYLPSMEYLLLEEIRMNETDLARMSNLVAGLFRIENAPSVEACIPALLSFIKWTQKAGPQQEALKRAIKAWFLRAQKPAKLIAAEDIDAEAALEEIEPMLSERIEKWSKELIEKGRAEGRTEGELKGRAEGEIKALLATATALLHKGMSTNEISEITGLSLEEIESLLQKSLS